ncbi:hypothetical protein RRG08_055753 [Elysia crispata]|uniref:Endonuclease/exonuclease/phosphatase domain-containing protein n=1 Tax=Elysia crispata TaxID=231223 RepID=A0AAE1AAD4_9GAST|nr:hypothetical protein RRG08_055753 [Elysia crispata]
MFTCYQSMTLQLTLGQCGVAPLVRGQDGAAPGPVPGRGPPYATDCSSDSLAMARGQQSRTTDHLLRIAHWNAEGGLFVYSPSNKEIDLQDIKPTPKSWIICGDFNSHSLAWGKKNLDAKGEDVEHWMTSNKLMLINIPYDEPTYFSRSRNTASTPSLAPATDDIQKVTQREVCSQLGGSDHKPVILNVKRDIKLNLYRLPPTWNYKKADWEKFQEIADGITKNLFNHHNSLDSNISTFTLIIIQAAKLSISRGRRKDYKPYWNQRLEDLHKQLDTARNALEKEPTDFNRHVHKKVKKLSKTVATLFSLSNQKETIHLQLDGEKIEISDNPAFLGRSKTYIETSSGDSGEQRHQKTLSLSLIKKLAGTTWGANLRILRQVYTGNVRPVAEYASPSWSTASKANKTRIDKVQNMGLRIIHGAIKSTPVWQMEKMVNIQPLETRRNFKMQCQAEKPKRLLSHPLHQPIKSRLQRKSLNHKDKELEKKEDTASQLPHII